MLLINLILIINVCFLSGRDPAIPISLRSSPIQAEALAGPILINIELAAQRKLIRRPCGLWRSRRSIVTIAPVEAIVRSIPLSIRPAIWRADDYNGIPDLFERLVWER